MILDESARALIGSGVDATLVTLDADGSPQVSVVWVARRTTDDGHDELVTAHLAEYRKTRNVRRDPRVAVTILGPPEPGALRKYLWIRGTARIVEGGAPELLTGLAETMLGSAEHFPPNDAPPGLRTIIDVDAVGGEGPWAAPR